MVLNREQFLRMLDSRIWVEDRIFFTRYIALYELTESKDLLNGLNRVMSILPSKTNILNSILPFENRIDLRMMAYALLTDLDFVAVQSKYASCPFSSLEQLFSDFQVYGLREALSYLCKAQDCSLSEELVSEICDYYAFVGNLFLANIDKLKKLYKAVVMDFIAGVEPLKAIMPEGYISNEAKMKYMLNPATIMNYLIAIQKRVVSGLDVKSKGATQLLILAESMNMGGFWQNGEGQNNYAL